MKDSVTQHFNKMLIVLIRQPLVSVLNIITFPKSVYEFNFFLKAHTDTLFYLWISHIPILVVKKKLK